MNDPWIPETAESLRQANDDEERIEILTAAARELDPGRPERYELAATTFAVAIDGAVDLARDALGRDDLQSEARFLFFAIGAIRCRRASDRAASREWFEVADAAVRREPLFKHLEALTYDGGNLRELRRGVELERDAHRALRPFAGGAHGIATFLFQIAESDGVPREEEEALLSEALDYVGEALDTRPRYAKFHYTRGRILRRLGQYGEARDALLQAIELESRDSVDANERVRDYRLELALIAVDQSTRRVDTESKKRLEDVDRKLDELEERTTTTVDRLKDAEVGVVTAVAFVASAIALVQVTVGNLGNRPFLEVIAILAAFGAILFGAVAVGSAIIRRR